MSSFGCFSGPRLSNRDMTNFLRGLMFFCTLHLGAVYDTFMDGDFDGSPTDGGHRICSSNYTS